MYFLFDIGGSKMRFTVSRDGKVFDEPSVFTTPQDFEEGMKLLERVFLDTGAIHNTKAVVGGIAGVLDSEKKKLLISPNLPKWSGKPLYKTISQITKTDVYLENDTALVGLGEASRGAGRENNICVYITISTGVGGVRIVEGEIDEGTLNSEPGHQIIDLDGSMCPTCVSSEDGKSFGHWESMISGASMQKRFGKHPSEIVDESVWDEHARYVAVGLVNTILHWSPDIVILGGGLMKAPLVSVKKIKQYVDTYLKIYPSSPEIKLAELGDFGGLYGGLIYVSHVSKYGVL